MVKTIRFYIESNRWYADIPEWTGPMADLEMVMGADMMLNIMSQGENDVTLTLFDDLVHDAESILSLNKLGGSEGGGYYNFDSFRGISYNTEVWLCNVTNFVFGNIPKTISIISVY
jgi:hypothetical protein